MVSLCPLHSKVSLLSSRQLYTDATTWITRRPSLLESTFSPLPAASPPASSPPRHRSNSLAGYSTCSGNGCPWRTSCCWTRCELDSTSRAWWRRNEEVKRGHMESQPMIQWGCTWLSNPGEHDSIIYVISMHNWHYIPIPAPYSI